MVCGPSRFFGRGGPRMKSGHLPVEGSWDKFHLADRLRQGERLDRRELLILGSTAIAWPLVVRAQQKAMPVIGLLNPASPGHAAPVLAAFRQGLSETGYVEGQNVAIEYRWAEGSYDRLPELAADLAGRKVDVIATFASPGIEAARRATSTIPIVFLAVGDPVADGQVASLARPGGNVTGISVLGGELTPKRIELLSEMAPQARVIGLLVNPNNQVTESLIRDAHEAARAKGVQLVILKAGAEGEIDAALATLVYVQAGMSLSAAIHYFFSGASSLWR